MKYKLIKVPADGHCFFHAVLHFYKQKPQHSTLKRNYTIFELRKKTASYIRKLYADPQEKSFVDFYVNEEHTNIEKYLAKVKKNMWAGPLEIYAISKALKIRIQIYNFDYFSKAKGVFTTESKPLIDFGDKRRKPIKLVIYGFDFNKSSGCHYNVLEPI